MKEEKLELNNKQRLKLINSVIMILILSVIFYIIAFIFADQEPLLIFLAIVNVFIIMLLRKFKRRN